MYKYLFIFALLLCFYSPILSQEADIPSQEKQETISVFLDCRGCDESFIITEIQFVNFVRDQGLADLHLLIIRQGTTTGAQFLIDYIDQRLPEKPKKELIYDSYDFQTQEEVRNGLVTAIELGLIGYLTDMRVLSQLSVDFEPQETTDNGIFEENDPWNNWIFEIGADGSTNGQENDRRFNIGGDAEARRITNEWKLAFNIWGNFNRRSVVEEEEVINGTDTTVVEVTEFFDRSNRNYFGLVAKTINDHWSVGFYSRYRSDTFVNIDTQIGITPAIEYSLFPYEEFTRREVTARIGVVANYFNYSETTVLLQDEEFLLRPELDLAADFTQPWGRLRAGVEAGAFLNDLSLNRFEFDGQVNVRISKYLSVFLNGRYSIIGDQISLPAGDLSAEELLAGVRQQPTSFSYRGSVGFEVQFGSIYNNIVNPRL
ncbi:MAG: hypothetical protein MI700_07105 [Balneolales bacterium]|nr:hypothetical protein [Balneolales bacterium]